MLLILKFYTVYHYLFVNSWFSHDVTVAMLVPLNKVTVAMFFSQTNRQGIEFCVYANFFFCFGLKIWQLSVGS